MLAFKSQSCPYPIKQFPLHPDTFVTVTPFPPTPSTHPNLTARFTSHAEIFYCFIQQGVMYLRAWQVYILANYQLQTNSCVEVRKLRHYEHWFSSKLRIKVLFFRHAEDRASWYILIINQLDALISRIYFWNRTLHVSDSFSVHHQESSIVHTVIHTAWRQHRRYIIPQAVNIV